MSWDFENPLVAGTETMMLIAESRKGKAYLAEIFRKTALWENSE